MTKLWPVLLWLFLVGLPHTSVAAQPEVTHLYPAGAQRGHSVEITAGGRFDSWPVRVWVAQPGLHVKPLDEKGKLEFRVAGDAPPGVYWVRFFDDEGSTPLKPFLIGSIPEVLEREPNDDPGSPQKLELAAVTVNGVLKPQRGSGRRGGGDVDGFAVSLRRDQTLVASVEAHKLLGSPMDAVLQVVSADGFVLAQNDDAPDLDPELVFLAPADGTYTVRVFAFPATPDSGIRFAGGDQFVYRLTLASTGFIDHTLPLAVAEKVPTQLELVGWNIPTAARMLEVQASQVADDGSGGPILLRVHRNGLSNAVWVRVEPHETMLEAETNAADNAQGIEIPVTVTGRINPAGDVDAYEFRAQQDQRLHFVAESRSLGFALDPVLRLLDEKGQTLSEVDDSDRNNRDPELTYTFSQDGKYRLEVRDANRFGGLGYVYRLRAVLAQASFVAKLAADRFTLTPGKTLEIPVTIEPIFGASGEVLVTALDLPDQVTSQPVKAMLPQQKARGKGKGSRTGSPIKATLKLTADSTTQLASYSGPIRIVVQSTENQALSRTATASVPGVAASSPSIWLTVKTK